MCRTIFRTYCSVSAPKPSANKRLPPLPSVGDILRMYGIRAKKSLSQNFILDPRILDGIAKKSCVNDKYVVEVGPGPGGITRSLLQAGAKEVYVIEKDPRFLPSLNLLKEAAARSVDGQQERLHINIGDCLTYNVEKMIPEEARVPWDSRDPANVVLVGNLPFNVATPFFLRLLASMDSHSNFYSFGRVPAILTFQHEVAHRMCAIPGDPQRCRLSAITQNYLSVDYLTTLPGGAFVPPPEVSVGLVKIVPHEVPYIHDLPFKVVNKVITGLFLSKKQRVLTSLKRHLIPEAFREEVISVMADQVPTDKAVIDLNMEEIAKICYAYDGFERAVKEHGLKTKVADYHGATFRKFNTKEKEKLAEVERNKKQQESIFDFQF